MWKTSQAYYYPIQGSLNGAAALGNRVDLLYFTGHDTCTVDDYVRLKSFGIATVREGIRWSQVEKQPGRYDWSEVINLMRAAEECGIQQI